MNFKEDFELVCTFKDDHKHDCTFKEQQRRLYDTKVSTLSQTFTSNNQTKNKSISPCNQYQ